jgi:hypothetical protein
VCQFHNVEQSDVSLAALDPADVVPMQLCQLRELLLRELAFYSQLADTSSENRFGGYQIRLNKSERFFFRPLETFSIFTSETFLTPRSIPR